MNLIQKISAGIITGALLTSVMAASAFAGTRHCGGSTTITNSTCKVTQKNTSTVITDVDSSVSTGGNTANNNGGKKKSSTVSITSGSATSDVNITIGGSGNTATNPCCGCQLDTVSAPSLVGDQSNGNSTIITNTSSVISQTNKSTIITDVDSSASTGGNKANNNSGGVTITSGDASSTVNITVDGSSNVLN